MSKAPTTKPNSKAAKTGMARATAALTNKVGGKPAPAPKPSRSHAPHHNPARR